ncbi:MAG: hypothetical protein M5U09_29525 [Gammaproteobacteria bacterium]|nr:hypothetical protein [Gammaproteobacteria bacterium]
MPAPRSERPGAARLRAALVLGGALGLSACAQWPFGPLGIEARGPVAARAEGFSLPLARPELQVGERWVWSARELGQSASGATTVIERTVVRVAGDQAELRQVALDPATRRPSGAAQMRTVRRSVWHLQPNGPSQGEIKALAFPLSIGKTRDYEYRLGGREIDAVTTYRYRAHVDGVETIGVPAGSLRDAARHPRGPLEPPRARTRPAGRTDGRGAHHLLVRADRRHRARLEVDLRRPDGAREFGVVQELADYRSGR